MRRSHRDIEIKSQIVRKDIPIKEPFTYKTPLRPEKDHVGLVFLAIMGAIAVVSLVTIYNIIMRVV